MKYLKIYMILVAFALSFFISCNETKDGELIPPVSVEEMGLILLELQYAEQKSIGAFPDSVDVSNKKMDRNFDSLAFFYQEVFERYDTNFETFKESLDWYKSNAKFLDQALNHAKEVLESHKIEKPKDEEEVEKRPKVLDFDNEEGIDSLPGGLKYIEVVDEEEIIN